MMEQTDTRGPILVVEDDQDIRETIATVLVEEGYPVVPVANGAEAIAYIRREGALQPRLILLDLMMPVMNGWEFSAELRNDAGGAAIPIVVLSGDRPTWTTRRPIWARPICCASPSLSRVFSSWSRGSTSAAHGLNARWRPRRPSSPSPCRSAAGGASRGPTRFDRRRRSRRRRRGSRRSGAGSGSSPNG